MQAKTRRRSARGTLLWALTAFVCFQGGLRVLIDSYFPVLRDPVFERKVQQLETLLVKCGARPKIVITLGSSSTYHAYHGKLLEEILADNGHDPCVVYNLAEGGAGPLTHLLFLRRLLEKNIRPDLVLVEVLPITFQSTSGPHGDELFDMKHFPPSRLNRRDLGVAARYTNEPGFRHEWRVGRLVPSYGHRLSMVNCLAPALVPLADRVFDSAEFDDHGWLERPTRGAEELAQVTAKVKAELEPLLTNFSAAKAAIDAREELLALLRAKGIPAVMVKMPIGRALSSLPTPEGIKALDAALTALGLKYQCPIVDATAWLDETMFTDPLHANARGAEQFSRRVALEFIGPLLP